MKKLPFIFLNFLIILYINFISLYLEIFYLPKPFASSEFLARIRALVRRSNKLYGFYPSSRKYNLKLYSISFTDSRTRSTAE